MNTIKMLNREVDRLLTCYYRIFADLTPVPEKDKQKLLDHYDARIQIARQMLANRKEVERLIKRLDLFN